MAKLQDDNTTAVLEQRMALGSQVVQLLRRMPQPVIAAVNGAAAGAGANLALSCDFRLGSDKALFSESFVKNWSSPRLGRLLLFVPPGWNGQSHGTHDDRRPGSKPKKPCGWAY